MTNNKTILEGKYCFAVGCKLYVTLDKLKYG